MEAKKNYSQLAEENEHLRLQLDEANETIEAIRTGQVDALVVKGANGHELYTLKSADQSYRVFIEKMIEGAVTLNRQKVIIYSNSRFAEMVNMPLSKVIGLSFETFIATNDNDFFSALFDKGFAEDCKEEIILEGNHRTTPCQLSLTTLDLDEGIALSIILTDLTTQKETQRQLKLKNEELEKINLELELSNIDLQQFAYVASHDLQEPLRKIQLFSTYLKDKHLHDLPLESQQHLERIISSSYRMKSLIVDILNYSRLSADNIIFEKTELKNIIDNLLEDFEEPILEKKAKIIVGELPVVEINPGQIRQVFQNLISNALKFSKAEKVPVIAITSKRVEDFAFNSKENKEGNFYIISVKDNGIGFNNKYDKQIFTLFERLHSKDKFDGTGIGLAIAKKVIEQHNGIIMATSIEGEGSEFIIILPATQVQ